MICGVIRVATAHSRPDLAAYNDAMRMPVSQLVTELRELLGSKLVAYLGNVKESRAVRQWADGTRAVNSETDVERLRIAYRAARLIAEHETPAIAQAWFQGLNPVLDDRAPALLLHEGDLTEFGPKVLSAAREFVAVGGNV